MLFIYRTFILQHLTADCLEDISADPGLGTLWEFSNYQMDSYKSPNIAGCKVYVLNLTHLKHHVSCLQTIKSEVLIEWQYRVRRNKLLILEMEIIKLITSVGTSQQPVQGHYYYTLLTLARLQTVYGDYDQGTAVAILSPLCTKILGLQLPKLQAHTPMNARYDDYFECTKISCHEIKITKISPR